MSLQDHFTLHFSLYKTEYSYLLLEHLEVKHTHTMAPSPNTDSSTMLPPPIDKSLIGVLPEDFKCPQAMSYVQKAWNVLQERHWVRDALARKDPCPPDMMRYSTEEQGKPKNQGKNRCGPHCLRCGGHCFDETAIFDEEVWLHANLILHETGHRPIAAQVSECNRQVEDGV